MNSLLCIKEKIKKIILRSAVPEDSIHSENTLKWLLKLNPAADTALQIAALGHDIDRAIVKRKVKQKYYSDYNSFKQAHAENSAKILKEIMTACQADKLLINDVAYLVSHHEIGGSTSADLIKDVDSISFFEVNLPLYYARHSYEETKQRCLWGYKRLSPNMIKHLRLLKYKDNKLQEMVNECLENKIDSL